MGDIWPNRWSWHAVDSSAVSQSLRWVFVCQFVCLFQKSGQFSDLITSAIPLIRLSGQALIWRVQHEENQTGEENLPELLTHKVQSSSFDIKLQALLQFCSLIQMRRDLVCEGNNVFICYINKHTQTYTVQTQQLKW